MSHSAGVPPHGIKKKKKIKSSHRLELEVHLNKFTANRLAGASSAIEPNRKSPCYESFVLIQSEGGGLVDAHSMINPRGGGEGGGSGGRGDGGELTA